MNANNDQFDVWLDRALAEYSAVEPPLGFEGRMLERLRRPRLQRNWLAFLAVPAFAAVIWAIAVLKTPVSGPPAPLQAKTTVPEIQKVEIDPRIASHRLVAAQRPQPTRGVPIVVPPVTREEEAILRVVRNSRAKQLAGVMTRPDDLSQEGTLLEIKKLEIAPILGERKP